MNVKKMLKDGAKQVLPDDKLKEQIKYRMGIGGESEADLGEVKAKRRNRTVIITSCVLAAAIAAGVLIPVLAKQGTRSPASPSDPGGIFGELNTADEVYGFSAASAMIMLGGMQADGIAAASALSSADGENIEKINAYMQMAESLTSGKGYSVAGGENTDGSRGYAYVMRVSYTDALGKDRDGGTIYYDKTFEEGEFEDGESEATYSLSGIMVTAEGEYPVRGTHESESESGESEEQYELRIDLGGGYVMTVEQEHESETEDGESDTETEYRYTLYKKASGMSARRDRDDDDDDDDGLHGYEQVFCTTAEYESEEGETELVITVLRDGEEETFEFEAEKGRMRVRLKGPAGEAEYTVRIEDGQYVYMRGGAEVGREDR